MRVWSHNALLGAAGMIESCANRVIRADTTTAGARAVAHMIRELIPALKAELKTRVD